MLTTPIHDFRNVCQNGKGCHLEPHKKRGVLVFAIKRNYSALAFGHIHSFHPGRGAIYFRICLPSTQYFHQTPDTWYETLCLFCRLHDTSQQRGCMTGWRYWTGENAGNSKCWCGHLQECGDIKQNIGVSYHLSSGGSRRLVWVSNIFFDFMYSSNILEHKHVQTRANTRKHAHGITSHDVQGHAIAHF